MVDHLCEHCGARQRHSVCNVASPAYDVLYNDPGHLHRQQKDCAATEKNHFVSGGRAECLFSSHRRGKGKKNTFGSANRAEAHRGWGWGIGAGIATARSIVHHYRPCATTATRITGIAITDQYIGVTTPATTGLAGITTTIAPTGTSIAVTVIADDDLKARRPGSTPERFLIKSPARLEPLARSALAGHT
jgi:hypothetical protein